MKSLFKKTTAAAAIAASLALTACVDSTDFGNTDTTPTAVVTLSGTATKGVLKQATVVICAVNPKECANTVSTNNGADLSGTQGYIGTAQTNDDGDYSFTVPEKDQGTAVMVRMFAVPGVTKMDCDFDGCTDTQDLSGLELKTVAFVETPLPGVDATVTASASALSTAATDTLIELGGGIDGLKDVTTKEVFKTVTDTASKSVATVLGIDTTTASSVNLFEVKIPNATAGDSKFDEADDTVKALSIVNASLASVIGVKVDADEDAPATLAAAIKKVTSTVSQAVTKGSSDKSSTTLGQITQTAKTQADAKVNAIVASNPNSTLDTKVKVPTADEVKSKVDESKAEVDKVKDTVTGGTGTGATGAQ
ncbi:hypothetical protein C2869_11900 [Saccharobesus litoralis]|uniref:Lipoprotein n=1 Tax=Saccharobesus litoralis TaxID=2172099 RepID=A0A2S0VS94_9ALTE|nr:hypothetical protein [Saccharobesus litoralis]AWB67091.1 hypothetical protein C2869_11900 [Saccharobesus litoralis]